MSVGSIADRQVFWNFLVVNRLLDFAELRAVAAANGQEGNGRTESPDFEKGCIKGS
jgi:hypothetical protein